MIPGPLLLLLIPLVMAGVVYPLLRWKTLAALLATGASLAMGVGVVSLPLDQPVFLWGRTQVTLGETVDLFGRELALNPVDRTAMAFLFFTAAAIFFLAWRAAQQSLIFPMGLGVLSLLNGALLIRPFIYALLLFEIAAALSVFALQRVDAPPSRGGMRYLTFTVLALPGVLIAHWLLDRYVIMPDRTELLSMSAILLAFSFALLLGVVPFHSWMTAIASDSAPLAGAFVFTVNNGVVWFLLLDFLETYPWLSAHPQFGALTFVAGLGMTVVGGALAPAQRRLSPLMGLAALVDNGVALITLGLNSKLSLSLSLFSLLIRPFSLALMAAGLAGLRKRIGVSDTIEALRGKGWAAPWSAVAFVVGGLSAAGLPISAGFAWRWALYRSVIQQLPGAVLLMILSSVGLLAGLWRWLSVLLARPESEENRSVISLSSKEGWLTALALSGAMAINVGLGCFPQSLALVANEIAGVYTFFIQ